MNILITGIHGLLGSAYISSEDEKTTIETIKKLHTYLKKKIKTDNIGVILYSPLPATIDKIKKSRVQR